MVVLGGWRWRGMHHRKPSEEETISRLRDLGCTVGERKISNDYVMRLYTVTREGALQVTIVATSASGTPLDTLAASLRMLRIEWNEFWEGLP